MQSPCPCHIPPACSHAAARCSLVKRSGAGTGPGHQRVAIRNMDTTSKTHTATTARRPAEIERSPMEEVFDGLGLGLYLSLLLAEPPTVGCTHPAHQARHTRSRRRHGGAEHLDCAVAAYVDGARSMPRRRQATDLRAGPSNRTSHARPRVSWRASPIAAIALVRRECLEDAMGWDSIEVVGVWGGTTTLERREARHLVGERGKMRTGSLPATGVRETPQTSRSSWNSWSWNS